jgi:hypothetical protein
MQEREMRIGKNEALFREVNDRIERVSESLEVPGEKLAILCECGNASCTEQVEIALPDYERVRTDGALFVVLHGHELPDVEDVVEESGSYVVVRKKEGGPAELARDLDPRS